MTGSHRSRISISLIDFARGAWGSSTGSHSTFSRAPGCRPETAVGRVFHTRYDQRERAARTRRLRTSGAVEADPRDRDRVSGPDWRARSAPMTDYAVCRWALDPGSQACRRGDCASGRRERRISIRHLSSDVRRVALLSAPGFGVPRQHAEMDATASALSTDSADGRHWPRRLARFPLRVFAPMHGSTKRDSPC